MAATTKTATVDDGVVDIGWNPMVDAEPDVTEEGGEMDVDMNYHVSSENFITPKAAMLNGGEERVLFSIGDLNAEQRSRLHYRRLGCPNLKDLQKASKEGTCKGLRVSSRLAIDDDPCVIKGRFKCSPYRAGPTKEIPCFHTISTDHVSGFPCKSIGGTTSAFITVDYQTNWCFCHLVKGRDEFPMVLSDLMTQIRALGPYDLCRLRSDSAPEIQAGESRRICTAANVLLEPTGVHCPEAGGKHESMVYSVCVRARTFMMLAPWMRPSTWGLAMLWACAVLRVTPIERHGKFASPHERVMGMKPDLRHMCIHVWGCTVSYGLTKAERMTTENRKLSSLTMEFYFGGMSGNMVLLVHQDTFVVYQGNAQKCHFYEGIFTERVPPKQSNPLGLLQEHVDNYVTTLKAQGLVKSTDGDSDGIQLVQSAQNMRPVSEIYDKIEQNFKALKIGDLTIFEGEREEPPVEAAVEGTVDDRVVQFVDRSLNELIVAELKKPEPSSSVETTTENGCDGMVTRTNGSATTQGDTLSLMPERATEEERKSKLASWNGIIVAHPNDGTTARVTEVSQRKKNRQFCWEWWLTLRWSDGFVKQYHEQSLCETLKLPIPTVLSRHGVMGRSLDIDKITESVENAMPKTITTADATTKRTALNQCESEPTPKRRKTRSGRTFCARFVQTFLSAVSTGETPVSSDEVTTQETPVPKFDLPPRGTKDPRSVYECLEAEDWQGWIWAAQVERKSWRQLNVYRVLRKRDRERRRNTYPLNDIWTRKYNAGDGSFDKHKCRLVVLGNLFRKGIDCAANTWAPTISSTALRVFFKLTVQLGYLLWKFDVKTAFLLAVASGKYYCFYPALFRLAEATNEELQEWRRIVKTGTDAEKKELKATLNGKYDKEDERVLEILSSVYGSPSAPREFFLHFREILHEMGFEETVSEPCLFQKKVSDEHTMRLVLHVDDGAISGPTEAMEEFVQDLQKRVKITFEKDVKEYTGIGIEYDSDAGVLKMHMKPTIEEAMRKFEGYYKKGMYATKTPMATNKQLTPADDAEHEAAKSLPYQSLVGVLVWCAVQVKIEAATAVSMLGTHAAKWSTDHFEEALRVLLWMYSHRDEGIVFRRDPAFNPSNCLIAYADADLAGDPETRRSRSGAAIMMGSTSQATCIAHRSALQKVISLSTAAAEIIALIDACMSVDEIRFLLMELGFEQTQPTTVFEDNQPCIAVVEDGAKPFATNKHRDMRIKKLKELQRQNVIKVRYCRTAVMVADIFTKNVNSVTFAKLAEYVTGRQGNRVLLLR